MKPFDPNKEPSTPPPGEQEPSMRENAPERSSNPLLSIKAKEEGERKMEKKESERDWIDSEEFFETGGGSAMHYGWAWEISDDGTVVNMTSSAHGEMERERKGVVEDIPDSAVAGKNFISSYKRSRLIAKLKGKKVKSVSVNGKWYLLVSAG